MHVWHVFSLRDNASCAAKITDSVVDVVVVVDVHPSICHVYSMFTKLRSVLFVFSR